jgi:hypothetical protein
LVKKFRINQKTIERKNAQKNAAIAIKRIILDLLSPKQTASNVPTIGLKITGVKNESP